MRKIKRGFNELTLMIFWWVYRRIFDSKMLDDYQIDSYEDLEACQQIQLATDYIINQAKMANSIL